MYLGTLKKLLECVGFGENYLKTSYFLSVLEGGDFRRRGCLGNGTFFGEHTEMLLGDYFLVLGCSLRIPPGLSIHYSMNTVFDFLFGLVVVPVP